MKITISLAVSAMTLLILGGCVSPSQTEQQTRQLASINASLVRIQANQAESIALQKQQAARQGQIK
ncbi:hypothetical protein [Pseudomonas fluorescens]|uniref:hypothetical protein n=1 Tax=Pseudomonas fluorescens TaxID=294 RepID=UPI001BED28F2|nr:hypothetical protein [Pseudomonas fluorescens]MBT2375555.1 hypothetical protein [Pseudomonas fluorescens]